jgi:hypothetical protein
MIDSFTLCSGCGLDSVHHISLDHHIILLLTAVSTPIESQFSFLFVIFPSWIWSIIIFHLSYLRKRDAVADLGIHSTTS